MRRRPSISVVVVLSALLAGLFAAQPIAHGQPTTRLRIAIKGYENNITPFTITFGALPATNDIMHLVYDSLFWSQVKAEPEPWLAESAVTDDGGRTWTVKLRSGVKWHDGRPFTAEDVKFSFDYYEEETSSAGRYAHHVSDTPDYKSSVVVDPLTVRLSFDSPAPQFKIMPGGDLPMLPKHIWAGITEPRTNSDSLPVGTGPYKLVEKIADQRYVMKANPDYFKGQPIVDELQLVVIPDPSAAFAALQTGDIDMVDRSVPPELVDQFRSNSSVKVAEGTRIESSQLYFNALKAPLSDPELRKGISMAINLDAVVKTVLQGHGRPGRDTFLHPDSAWAVAGGSHEYDLARARAKLDAAGYKVPAAGGSRRGPDGKPLEFSVLVSSFEPLDIRAVQLIGEQLGEINVKLTVETLEPAALRARRQAPPGGGPPTYDLYVSGLEAHAHVDPDALYYFFHSPGTKGFGGAITGYTNAAFDTLVERATGAGTAERKTILADAQQILAKEMPAIVMYYPDGLYAYRPGAYDRWLSDLGQGIFTKRSFLEAYAPQPGTGAGTTVAGGGSATDDSDGSGALILVGVVAVAGIGGAVLFSRRRRAASTVDD